jgi:hypothetical protein
VCRKAVAEFVWREVDWQAGLCEAELEQRIHCAR